MNELLI